MAKVFKLKSCSHSFSSNLTGFRINDQIDQTQSTAERRPVAQNNSQTTKKHKLALLIFLVELGNNLIKKKSNLNFKFSDRIAVRKFRKFSKSFQLFRNLRATVQLTFPIWQDFS